MRELILGGVRSGKSHRAETLARTSGKEVVYIATATAADAEMAARIERHRGDRPSHWLTIEEPLAVAQVLTEEAAAGRCLIVDCLTLWLTNLLLAEDPARLEREQAALLAALPGLPGRIILVSNETNMGVVPMDALSRRFCDTAGRLHQHLGQLCERVTLMVAGLALEVK